MIKEVPYNGYTANPSDYEAPDGDLTTSINLISEDGQIKPIFQPKEVCTLPRGLKFVHIHQTSTFTHYIAIDETTRRIYWIDKTDATGSIVREYIQALAYEVDDVVLHPEVGYIRFTQPHVAGAALTGYEFTSAGHGYPTLTWIYGYSASLSIFQINSIGNTLILLTNDGVYYFLWKESGYNFIGNHIPELPISFGLQGHPVSTSSFLVGNFSTSAYLHVPDASNPIWKYADSYGHGNSTFDSAIDTMTSAILAKVNKLIKEEGADKGRFIMPFFVCYAFRLYDGSLTMRSAPVLMIPNSGAAPQVLIASQSTHTGSSSSDLFETLYARVGAVACDLDYACIDSNARAELRDNWSDIVKSVDIFISAPIYTYDQSENTKIQGVEFNDSFPEYTISFVHRTDEYLTVSNGTISGTNFDILYYRKTPVFPLLFKNTESFNSNSKYRFILPTRDEKKVFNNIRECSNFYLLKSIDIKDIDCKDYSSSTTVLLEERLGSSTNRDPKSPRTVIDIDDGYLEALVTKEEMEMAKETNSHDLIAASFSYVYNQRLNLSNIYKRLVMPFNPATFLPFYNPTGMLSLSQDETSVVISFNTGTIPYTADHNNDIYLRFIQDSKQVVSRSPRSTNVISGDAPFIFFYYPSIYAEEAVIYKEKPGFTGNTLKKVITLPLKKHDNLNGAVYFDGWDPTQTQSGWVSYIPSSSIPTVSTDNTIPLPNKLYTSEINNPFLFPYINTIGTGTILGISSAAKALSQGQFGQFPLYAFCTDGVWALEVSSTGIFSARQPITRDVCINPDSITQLDNAVLFASDRGIMLVQGSDTICITDSIATEQPFNVLSLSHASDLHTMLGHSSDACLPTQPFLLFLQGCQMVYDYIHQHLIVYNASYSYSYVYSLKSKRWGMMYSTLNSSLNSYPDAQAMAQGNHLVSFSDTDDEVCKGLLVTRPLKLDSPDVLKSIHTLVQRGMFQRGDIKTVLYGSRDLYSWHLVAHSTTHDIRNLRGTPYKYFRIAAVATLTDGKSISGVTIDVISRHTSVIQ